MFLSSWGSISDEAKIAIHNDYCHAIECIEDVICENYESFLDEFLSSHRGLEVSIINYNREDKYYWSNGYNRLCSSNFVSDMPIYKDEIFEYIIDDASILSGYNAFEDFVEAVK